MKQFHKRQSDQRTPNGRNHTQRNKRRRNNYRVGMVHGQCWNCRQKNMSCARLETGRFICKDCDSVTYGEAAQVEKERWINGK